MESTYITSALKPEQLPDFDLPEIAFFGRSNTGKSTLLNVLLNRKSLARKSRTPGRTQMVNFFDLDGKLIFADLPGFGFSKAPKSQAQHWQGLVDAYVKRSNIKEFLFLTDARRDLADLDFEIMFHLGRQIPIQVILTKSDKLSKSQQKVRLEKTRASLEEKGIYFNDLYLVSSLKRTGLAPLQGIMNHYTH